MTPDELKSMPKGQFVVMKTGAHPMKVKLKLFYKWGIKFDEDNPYIVLDNGNRKVEYAEKKEIIDGIVQKYHPEWMQKQEADNESSDGQNQSENESNAPRRTPPMPSKKRNGSGMNPVPPSQRKSVKNHYKREVEQNGQT